jgi:hypothetical protein
VVRVDGHVGEVGAVDPVGERPPGGHQGVAVVGEAREHAVAEHCLEGLRRLVAERGDPVQLGQLVKVDSGAVVDPAVLAHDTHLLTNGDRPRMALGPVREAKRGAALGRPSR